MLISSRLKEVYDQDKKYHFYLTSQSGNLITFTDQAQPLKISVSVILSCPTTKIYKSAIRLSTSHILILTVFISYVCKKSTIIEACNSMQICPTQYSIYVKQQKLSLKGLAKESAQQNLLILAVEMIAPFFSEATSQQFPLKLDLLSQFLVHYANCLLIYKLHINIIKYAFIFLISQYCKL
ncbi:unnamed protein product [Paramecium primaurelia]|uniref:Uncharacterized protein n=1 Tax=Paramecium primaurelia TaxID=5886 RepID=A0A8S1QCL0_PARPR|nr:unnamed protein product [Paramecium primaurelia]